MTESTYPPQTSSKESSAAVLNSNSINGPLADLCAKGGKQYAEKNYELAADFYSRASELQVELNGEMNPENAEILFRYGRSLFKLGQSKSDVLGEVPGNQRKKPKPETDPETSTVKNEEKSIEVKNKNKDISTQEYKSESINHHPSPDANKKLFQFTGDENFEASDQEEVQIKEDDEEDSDDLAAAFDVLDLARVLFEKKLKALEVSDDNGEKTEDPSIVKHCKKRLADTHDHLAEISLENESFSAAVADCKASLAYKKQLYAEEESIIAEAHFKLSLALEFAAITTREGDEIEIENKEKVSETDKSLRNEAAEEMEAAIKSTNLRLQNKESLLATLNSPKEVETVRNQITEIKEMLSELQTRLEELRTPVFDVKSALYGPLVSKLSILNAPTALNEADTRIEEAKKMANDVTDLVRKKSKVVEEPTTISLGEKRKGDNIDESESKRTKIKKIDDDDNVTSLEKD
ncbi:putative histone h1-binding protein [Erysiphe necator]|uniref:Putative histone h1-binding protein n=1 Tax=Uncinula necator TaxID=52586 RepID=A0A0B1PAH0_UNCNE|nr:putative histone h1-binding protein [Erysiphe necator]